MGKELKKKNKSHSAILKFCSAVYICFFWTYVRGVAVAHGSLKQVPILSYWGDIRETAITGLPVTARFLLSYDYHYMTIPACGYISLLVNGRQWFVLNLWEKWK